MKKRVVVGMSGGVDSSVAAYILKNEGFDVIGVTMQVWQEEDREIAEDNDGCCGLSAVDDARYVAETLDIPYYVLNFKKVFKESVIDYFVSEYLRGRTPNPCIACNRYVKWEAMLERAMQMNADFIATGHYSRIATHPITGRYCLRTSTTAAKDQTYALYSLTQFQLQKTLMPIGDYEKSEVREIAKKIGLSIADKPDSQEICFIPDNNYGKYISSSEYAKNMQQVMPGDFIDVTGKVIGKHRGVVNYTIGQRKGLGISFGKSMYVKNIDVEKNQVTLSEESEIFNNILLADNINLMCIDDINKPLRLKAKIRYSHKPADCIVSIENGLLKCVFDVAQRAITPGQSVVLYDNEYVVGGGVIVQSI